MSIFELVSGFDSGQILFFVKLLALFLAVIALAAAAYLLKATFGPLIQISQWLVAYTPGTKPSAFVSGLSHGLRMTVWAVMIAATIWFFIH